MNKILAFLAMFILVLHFQGLAQSYSYNNHVCVAPTASSQAMTLAVSYPYYPANSTLKALIIFVRFSDDHYELSPYTDMWPDRQVSLPSWASGIISSTVQPTYTNPSLSGFFDDMSRNQFQLIGDVYPVLYTPLHTQSYYYRSSGRGIHYLTEEILTELNPYINYAAYDNLAPGGTAPDGIVDMIFICFRFYSSENLDVLHYTGYASLTGSYGSFGSGASFLTLDGKKIYAGFPGSGTIQSQVLCPHDIGIIAHEYGHYLFGGGHFNIGTWCLMEVANGMGPMCGFERAKLNWLTPSLVTSNCACTLHDAMTTGDVIKLEVTPGSSRYFLAENRQKVNYYESSWRAYNGGPIRVKGTGLLVTHVTSASSIDVECADKMFAWQKNGSYYVYPFTALNPNPFTGEDEMDLRDKLRGPSDYVSHPDCGGDAEDLYNLPSSSQYNTFSPWNNPNSNSTGGQAPDNFSSKGFVVKTLNGTDMTVDVYASFANINLSSQSDATSSNSQRKICRSSDGKYHLVFESEKEIYYRRLAVDGVTWELSKYLSSGDFENSRPSVTCRDNKIFVTWQKKINSSSYKLYFRRSDDAGTTWPSTGLKDLGNLSTSYDPLPVISAPPSTSNLVIVYRVGSSLKSKHSSNNGDTWGTTLTISGTSLNSPSVALVNQPGSDYRTGLVYANGGDNHVYWRYYNGSSAWTGTTNLSSIVPGTASNQTPSISGENNNSQGSHIAWFRDPGINPISCSIIYRRSSSFGIWPSEYTQIYYDQSRPTIAAFSSSSVDVVYQTASNPSIYRQHYNGSQWTTPIYVATGQNPSVSIGGTGITQGKYVWTSTGAQPPYEVKLGSGTLSKESDEDQQSYERAVAWMDSSGSYLSIRVHDFGVQIADGKQFSLSFLPVTLDTINFKTPNAWSFLASLPSVLPTDADSLIINLTISGEKIEKVASEEDDTARFYFVVEDAKQIELIKTMIFAINPSGKIDKRLRLAIGLDAIKDKIPTTTLKLVAKFEGLNAKTDTFASLGHIYDFIKTDKKVFLARRHFVEANDGSLLKCSLSQNYPNPFNPETTIKYQIAETTPVSLKIYNFWGQEVLTLVDGIKEVGTYEVQWSAKNKLGEALPSGVYVYRLQAGDYVESKKLVLLK